MTSSRLALTSNRKDALMGSGAARRLQQRQGQQPVLDYVALYPSA
jgi:hypothetical protein